MKKQQKIELNAQPRTVIGGRLLALRKSGLIPAVLYGKNQEPLSLQVPLKDFAKAFESAGESTLVYINIDGQAYPVIINDVAWDPVTDEVLHADFYKVRLDQKIKTNVPVEFVGEAPAVKENGGIFVRNVNELEVEGLPQDLPHELTIDISNLVNFGDQILIKDIQLAPGLRVVAEPDEIVATVQEPMSEEELQKALEAPTETVEDVKVVEKEKEEEVPEEEGESPQEQKGEQEPKPEKNE